MLCDQCVTVTHCVCLPDVCPMSASSVLCLRLELRSPDCLQPRTLPPELPELSNEAVVIGRWCLRISVDWSRGLNEISDLRFLSDRRPVGEVFQKTLELSGHVTLSLGWRGPQGTC